MDTWIWVVIVVAVLAVVGVAAVAFIMQRNQKQTSKQLHDEFGPEYGRAVSETGDRRRAESELQARQKRVEALQIRSLEPDERDRFGERWQATQAEFVDAPDKAIAKADQLVAEVMQARGYPVGQFEQRAADISVQHPNVVRDYRAAHGTAQAQERGEANTEDLRQAMIHYRALFVDMLDVPRREKRRAG